MTDTPTLATALERKAEPQERRTILDLVERMQPEIGKALGDAIGAERFARIVQTEIRRVPQLLDCSPESVLGAMMLSAQLGLEPGPLGHVYLVPFKGECTWILGYKGMVQLAFRSDQIKTIDTAVVREGDFFDYEKGTRNYLRHKAALDNDEAPITHAWALAQTRAGGKPFEVMNAKQIEKHMKRSPAARNKTGPWMTDYEPMARKTPLRTLAKLLPQSPQLARGLARDEQPAPEFDAEGELVDVESEPESEDA